MCKEQCRIIQSNEKGWNGRMKACRGTGVSLTGKEISMWEQEHMTLFGQIRRMNLIFCIMQLLQSLKSIKFRLLMEQKSE